jgi:hypothetical protein
MAHWLRRIGTGYALDQLPRRTANTGKLRKIDCDELISIMALAAGRLILPGRALKKSAGDEA